ncbi:hypothetical protein ACQY0O_000381 [Thecaphora frezii]
MAGSQAVTRIGPDCGLPYVLPPKVMPRSDDEVAVISPSSGITMSVKRIGRVVAYSFQFPERLGGCAVHLIQADTQKSKKEKKANRIFKGFQQGCWPSDEELQRELQLKTETPKKRTNKEDKLKISYLLCASGKAKEAERTTLVPFQRHPLRNAALKGTMLTQQFTVNYGMAYKHVVAMGTHPINATTPLCIVESMALIRKRTAVVCSLNDDGMLCSSSSSSSSPTKTPEPLQKGFNEAYGCLYLPFQSMSFHDDGEPGLGPIVASLSLGAEATIKFRVKAKFLVDSPPPSRAAGAENVKAMRDEMQIENRHRTVLTLRLRHGSVCVQEGEELQRRFEHAVEPTGFRIACTTRSIDPDVNGR